jgi:radical SAM protein with 4Fe4S-binding SPASM domain
MNQKHILELKRDKNKMSDELMEFISPWIHTTDKCNLKCHYCYVKGNNVMGEEVYEALGKFLLNSPAKKRHLRFAGGEPLLVFDKWENFARKMLDNEGTSVEVLTNFISVPENFWKFSELSFVNVSVSVDNGKSIKVLDKSIANKIQRLKNPWILTTVTQENVDNLNVLAAFIGKNNYGWCITTDYFEKTMPHWAVLYQRMLEVIKILKEFDYDFARISFNNCSMNKNFSGCRAGDEMFAVAPDGKIYACQTLIGKNSIGDVWKGYERKKIEKRNNCNSCEISEICSGWCPLYFKPENNPVCDVIKMFSAKIMKEIYNAK